jgi:hypothetical protein
MNGREAADERQAYSKVLFLVFFEERSTLGRPVRVGGIER